MPWLKPGKVFSVAPKLCEMTSPTPALMSDRSAFIISGRPVTPSVSATGVSARTIFAPGAMECAYSTSRVVSSAQPTWVSLVGSNGGTLPNFIDLQDRVREAELLVEDLECHCAIVGEPKELTITIVLPRPVTPRL